MKSNHPNTKDIEQMAKDSGFDNSDEAFMSAFADPNTKQTVDEILFPRHQYVTGLDNDGDGEPDQWTYTLGDVDRIKAQLAALIKDPYDFVEPCEPECSPERHAYHQGQWDMATRMAKGTEFEL